jgi:hypothetical protein
MTKRDDRTCEAELPDVVTLERAVEQVSPERLSSPVLRRLLEEIRDEGSTTLIDGYNRTHNRHNRGR